MNKKEYEILFKIEDNYWWHVGLRELVLFYIEGTKLKILDAGCGTGKMLETCKGQDAYGIDYSQEALKYCKQRNLTNILRGSISCLPYKSNSFDTIISLDVLYHKAVEDDVEALKELYRVMNKDGMILLNLATYDFLKSRHDEAVHTHRRYTKKTLKEKMEKAGFEIDRITYRNSILFPIALIKRMIEIFILRNSQNAESDLKQTPSLVNKLLQYLVLFENKLITLGISFPFGLSIYCVARKNSNN